MSDYGSAVIHKREDGRLEVVRADDTIGISCTLLAEDTPGLPVDSDGCIWLAGDPGYRYRPVRFAGPPSAHYVCAQVSVVVCERVREAAEGVG